mgnify:FL=1
MLEFCKFCNNLLYISVDKNILIKECKCCLSKEEINNESRKISETNYTNNKILYQKYYAEIINGIPVNKILATDPTLPRIIDPKITPPEGYQHDPNTSVSYIKHIDQTYLWISNTTGEIWY